MEIHWTAANIAPLKKICGETKIQWIFTESQTLTDSDLELTTMTSILGLNWEKYPYVKADRDYEIERGR